MDTQLPGFMPPSPDKEQSRVFARTDGKIEVPFFRQSQSDHRPARFNFTIALEYADDHRWISASDNARFFIEYPRDGGFREFVLTIMPDEIPLAAGSYILRINVDGVEVLKKSLVVPLHPRLAGAPQ